MWRRDAVFDFNGSVIRSEEMFFVLPHRALRAVDRGHTAAGTPLPSTGTAGATRRRSRELVDGGETVYPLQLGELLAEANALAAAGSTGPARSCNRSADR